MQPIARRLDTRQLAARARSLVEAGVTSIAVVFLHSYANPRNEAEAARLISRRHPTIAVTASHEVAPEIREYERTSTTVANAYVKPLAQRYLVVMAERLTDLGIPQRQPGCAAVGTGCSACRGGGKSREAAGRSPAPPTRRPAVSSGRCGRRVCPSYALSTCQAGNALAREFAANSEKRIERMARGEFRPIFSEPSSMGV